MRWGNRLKLRFIPRTKQKNDEGGTHDGEGDLELTVFGFGAQVGRTLIDVVEKETKGDFEFALRGLVLGPLGWDLWLVDRVSC